ncbi:MAG TPA: SGNH/GDSL hydrolase family protein [Rugosimonospora sp.]
MGIVRQAGRQLGRATAITVIASAIGGTVLLAAQALAARTHRYARPDLTLAMRTSVGPLSAPALRLVLLGDSSALGVGVDRVTDTVGGRLAELLAGGAESDGRRIELSSVAVSGSRAEDLATQVARALVGDRPDVAVVLIGTNDAIRPGRPRRSAAHLAGAVRRLRDAEVAVVVGTCPDLGAVRAFAPPLRQLVGLVGRRVADAQSGAVRAAGGIPVDLARQVGPVFRADAGTLCHDGFHPSADGYRVWAHALHPAVAEAAGVTSR